MKRTNNLLYLIQKLWRYSFIASMLTFGTPDIIYGQTSLAEINEALEDETENVVQTGRLVSNIIVVIAFVLLMLNIVFKVMDNSKATVVFLFILFLRGLYEVVF